MAYSIQEFTKNLYVSTISNCDVTLDATNRRMFFNDKASAEAVLCFCNAIISDCFKLVEEQEVTVRVTVTGTTKYFLSGDAADREDALNEAESTFSCIDFCDLDVIVWDVEVSDDLETATFDVTGEVLITGITPDINDIQGIIHGAEYRASNMDFGLLENIRFFIDSIGDASGNIIYEA